MDAYDLADKLKKYWAAVYPKNSGEINKVKKKIKVLIYTPDGYREVVGVVIKDESSLELKLDGE